ncbi:MAG: right-handed parallel beta-helix repeat-containing protein, partial [Duncaniella sp.]|nr:right-handed parallel beta-helix repeat-containing protein [Duncaniella sp.]
YINVDAEPTTQCSVALSEITGSGATSTLTPGNGSGRLVAVAEGDAMTWAPADGTAYTGSFPKTVDGVTLVASGDVTFATIAGLTPGRRYTVAAWEYNGDGDARNYLTPGATAALQTLTVPVLTWGSPVLDFRNTRVGGSKEMTVSLSGYYLSPAAGTLSLSVEGSEFAVSPASVSYADGAVNAEFKVTFTPSGMGETSGTLKVIGGGTEAVMTLTGTGADKDSRDIYIAPDGDDTADGSMAHPWMNLQKAVNEAQPGDVIWCRGGRYHFTMRDGSGKLTVRIKKSGSAEAPITIRNYPGEQPIFDFEQQLLDCKGDRSKVGDRGMLITGNHWYLYGLHIMHAADNGIKLEGSYNRIERCEFSYNLDSGLQMGFGHNFADSGLGSKNDGSFCAYNDIIDCDSHHNCDYDANYGSDADGFACKMHNGKGNRFIRCRAWRNSDDAWDLYETDFPVVLIECWAWHSGKAEDHTWVYEYFGTGPGFSGNGNGIKLGGNGSGGSSKGLHEAWNCVAFGCDKSGSTKGFDCNSHKDGHLVVGGLAFDNGYDFMFESGGGANSEFYNNGCFGRQEILVGTESHNALGVTPNQGKTFWNNVVTGFSRSDYVSLSEADALAPRGEDGSMPAKFARLRSGSKLVDAGLDKRVPFTDEFSYLEQPIYGKARDLGPYELREGEPATSLQMLATPGAEWNLSVMSSGRGGEMLVEVSAAETTEVILTVTAINGTTVTTLPLGIVEGGTTLTAPLPER